MKIEKDRTGVVQLRNVEICVKNVTSANREGIINFYSQRSQNISIGGIQLKVSRLLAFTKNNDLYFLIS